MSNELKPFFFIWFAVFQAVTNACLHRSAATHSFIFIFYVWYGLFCAFSSFSCFHCCLCWCSKLLVHKWIVIGLWCSHLFCAALIKCHRPRAVNVIYNPLQIQSLKISFSKPYTKANNMKCDCWFVETRKTINLKLSTQKDSTFIWFHFVSLHLSEFGWNCMWNVDGNFSMENCNSFISITSNKHNFGSVIFHISIQMKTCRCADIATNVYEMRLSTDPIISQIYQFILYDLYLGWSSLVRAMLPIAKHSF